MSEIISDQTNVENFLATSQTIAFPSMKDLAMHPIDSLKQYRQIGMGGIVAKSLTGLAYVNGEEPIKALAVKVHPELVKTISPRIGSAFLDFALTTSLAPLSIPLAITVAYNLYQIHPALGALSAIYEAMPGGLGALARTLYMTSRAYYYQHKYGDSISEKKLRLISMHADFSYLWSWTIALPKNKDLDALLSWRREYIKKKKAENPGIVGRVINKLRGRDTNLQ